jgi:hypothetical protein
MLYCFVKDKFLYLNIPRNGSNTFGDFFKSHGWEKHNLFENKFDLTQMKLFGHLTDPNRRHTKGLAMYIRLNRLANSLDDPQIAKMLVSGVFDEHTCSISMMLGSLFYLPITWIPLDLTVTQHRDGQSYTFDGNDLTNVFFKENNLDLHVSKSDIRNELVPEEKIIREKISKLKLVYNQNYQQIFKNFIEPDMLLYSSILKKYRDQYES